MRREHYLAFATASIVVLTAPVVGSASAAVAPAAAASAVLRGRGPQAHGFVSIRRGVYLRSIARGDGLLRSSDRARSGRPVSLTRRFHNKTATLVHVKRSGKAVVAARAGAGDRSLRIPGRWVSTRPHLFRLRVGQRRAWVLVDTDGGPVRGISLRDINVVVVNWIKSGIKIETDNYHSLDQQFFLRPGEKGEVETTGTFYPWDDPPEQLQANFRFTDDPDAEVGEETSFRVENPPVGEPGVATFYAGEPTPIYYRSVSEGQATAWLGDGIYYYVIRHNDDSCRDNYKCFTYTFAYPPKGVPAGSILRGKDSLPPRP